MVKCDRCDTYKEPSCGYSKHNGQMHFWAGLVCPACQPERAGIQEEPDWWRDHFNKMKADKAEPVGSAMEAAPAKAPTGKGCLPIALMLLLIPVIFGFVTLPVSKTAVPISFSGPEYNLDAGTVYLAHVIRVKDGDTFEAAISIWDDLVITKSVRVKGIDTAEKKPRKKDHLGRVRTEEARQAEREDAAEATYWAERLLQGKGAVYVGNIGTDNFGRTLADVYIEDDRRSDASVFISFAGVMIERGLAVKYYGGKRSTWNVPD